MLYDPSLQSMRAVSVTVNVMWKCPRSSDTFLIVNYVGSDDRSRESWTAVVGQSGFEDRSRHRVADDDGVRR